MARIAYVDMAFHKKTLSTQFLATILQNHGHKVDFFWDNSLYGEPLLQINKVRHYDAIIMFQVQCKALLPYTYYNKNITFIPMLDSHFSDIQTIPRSRQQLIDEWGKFGHTKICNFSSYLHNIHKNIGIYSKYFQYFPQPEAAQKNTGLHGFFWARRNDLISLETIYSLIRNTYFDSFHIHLTSDPGASPATIPEQFAAKIGSLTTSTWFDNKEAFLHELQKANVFFAPRPVEGIGQSFLEAMSYGQCVVAPNFGTMNEYIQHGFNGLLYDRNNPMPLDFSNIDTLCENAYTSIQKGHEAWKNSEVELVKYILTPARECYAQISKKNILKPKIRLKKLILGTKIGKQLKPYIKPVYDFFKKT